MSGFEASWRLAVLPAFARRKRSCRAAARLLRFHGLCWLLLLPLCPMIASCQRNDVEQMSPSDVGSSDRAIVVVRVETSSTELPPLPAEDNVQLRRRGPVVGPRPGVGLPIAQTLSFEHEGNDTCWQWHRFTITFPPPGSPARFLAFALPPGRWIAKETLRAGEDGQRHVPTFHVGEHEIVYLGRLILHPSGDLSQEPEVLPPAIRGGSIATQIFGFGSPLQNHLCGP